MQALTDFVTLSPHNLCPEPSKNENKKNEGNPLEVAWGFFILLGEYGYKHVDLKWCNKEVEASQWGVQGEDILPENHTHSFSPLRL